MRFALVVVAYVAATLLVQAVSHFGINAGHYAAVPFMRPEAIAVLGVHSRPSPRAPRWLISRHASGSPGPRACRRCSSPG